MSEPKDNIPEENKIYEDYRKPVRYNKRVYRSPIMDITYNLYGETYRVI